MAAVNHRFGKTSYKHKLSVFFFNFISKMNWIVALAYLTKETRFIQQFAFYACIRRTRLMDDSDASFLNVSQDISNLYID